MENKLKDFPLVEVAKILNVSRSSYYKWKTNFKSKSNLSDELLLIEIKIIHEEHNGLYGSPRITKELHKKGKRCNKKRVARLMRKFGIKYRHKKKYKNTTNSNHDGNIAKNLLKRNFKVSEPDKVWCSDITYIWTEKGWLYLCIVLDLFNRKIVGWSMNDRLKQELVIDALKMAVSSRKPKPGLIFHSDRGVQYASNDLIKETKKYGILRSMSRKGDCWDNAVAESFFHTLKIEEVYGQIYRNKEITRNSIFEYIEVYYNRKRIHSYLNYESPSEFEENYYRLKANEKFA